MPHSGYVLAITALATQTRATVSGNTTLHRGVNQKPPDASSIHMRYVAKMTEP